MTGFGNNAYFENLEYMVDKFPVYYPLWLLELCTVLWSPIDDSFDITASVHFGCWENTAHSAIAQYTQSLSW